MKTKLGPLTLKNPVMTASGCGAYGEELAHYYSLNRLGAFITKGISLNPKTGNEPPRTCETAGGMLNAIGLENVGFDKFVKAKLPFLKTFNIPIIANVFGKTIEEYETIAAAFNSVEGVTALELNISCPNVDAGGRSFGTDPDMVELVVTKARLATSLPIFVKLSPMVSDIVEIAKAAMRGGATGLTLINTIPAMAIDLDTKRPVLGNVTGGLSGAAIKPVALYAVYKVRCALPDISIIGSGGIYNARDALEFIVAGADAVQIGTANFVNPFSAPETVDGIIDYLKENEISSLKQLRGKAHEKCDVK